MDLLSKAKKLLMETEATCVAVDENKIYQSEKKGIAPIFDKLEEDREYFCGMSIADKVIGKSAAMLLIKGKIKELYAAVISEYAIDILIKHQIPFTFTTKVPYIINRTKTDMCPMEKSVLETNDIEEAYEILKKTLENMRTEK